MHIFSVWSAFVKVMKLFLFTSNLELAKNAEKAGVYSAIVDWERLGKQQRQSGHDFEINSDTAEDAAHLARHLDMPVTVRVNPLGPHTEEEVERALEAGAEILMLPQSKTPSEVATFTQLVGNRAKTLIQIETQDLVERCEELKGLKWDFAHVGLNDLRISRGSSWLWEPVYDGTVEKVCRTLEDKAVGFGGGTIIGGGDPIPFIHLLREMARLHCGMCILRRTFKSDLEGRDIEAEIEAFYAKWAAVNARGQRAINADHQALQEVLRQVQPVMA